MQLGFAERVADLRLIEPSVVQDRRLSDGLLGGRQRARLKVRMNHSLPVCAAALTPRRFGANGDFDRRVRELLPDAAS